MVAPPTPLDVDVWSDVACPWCWVGKRQLEAAIDAFGEPVSVRWHAFELDPRAPRSFDESFDYVERLARKYGTSHAGARMMIDRMVAVGKAVGLDFRFDRIRPGNTLDAHRLLRHAQSAGVQSALKERLFEAYMHEGRSVSDASELLGVAASVGLDTDTVAGILASDDLTDAVRADEAEAARLGISGVPFFVFGRRFAVPGAQAQDVLLQVMRRARSALDSDAATLEEGDACTPESC